MIIKIDKNNAKDLSKILSQRLKKKPKKSKLSEHFGKLKRNIDGLDYEQKIRESESWFSCGHEFHDLHS
jgi:hypothetical protein